jgi:hypothetical protein
MSTKKRQHFVPKLLLRRFRVLDGKWQGHVFRLDRATGRITPSVPKTEGAKNRYYDLPDDVTGGFQPEAILEKVESRAASAIGRLENHEALDFDDGVWLAYFAAIQTARTPQDRAERRYLDGVLETELQIMRLGAQEQAVKAIQELNPGMTAKEADKQRTRILSDLETGDLQLQSTAEREVAGMFLGLNESIEQLVEGCEFTLVEFPQAPALVLPDTGYTRYDPSPRVPDSGSGFIGSQTVETVIPVRPDAALVITPGQGGAGWATGDSEYANDLNLRSYSQCEKCLYGRFTIDLLHINRLAARYPAAVHERRRRARTLWIAEGKQGDPATGPVEFVGYSIDGVRKQRFDVDPRAFDNQQPITPDDLWA